jgi:putative Mg2+ transporter-C (MgtC) family protein
MFVHDLALFGRIAAATGLGYSIGFERELRSHSGGAAGARTFGLVAAGAAGFTTIGIDAFPFTAEKLIAGIVTGVGFIGAGVLLRSPQGTLQGLTTATAIWTSSAAGVIAGGGRLVLATLLSLLVLVVLEARHIPVLRLLDPQHLVSKYGTGLQRETMDSS